MTETQPARIDGQTVRVPRRFSFEDRRQGMRVSVEVEAVHLTDMDRAERSVFVQMRGVATVEERGQVVGRLRGFFETYVD